MAVIGHKRKYGDRRDWPRITSYSYAQTRLSDGDFDGYLTLYRMNEVAEPLFVPNCGQSLCIVEQGHSWVHLIPLKGLHVVTAMFDAKGEIVQWYIDICAQTGVGEDNVPWFDDLYLDVVVLPTGQFELLDADELKEALDTGMIDRPLYDLAWQEANAVQQAVAVGQLATLERAARYRDTLLPLLTH